MNEDTKTLIKKTGKPKTKTSSIKVVTAVDDLKAQFDTAKASENWKDVARLAREISRAERVAVEAVKEAHLKKTYFLRDCFRNVIETAINELCDNLSEDELQLVEGVWLSRDFGNGDFDVRIIRDRMPKTRAKKGS